MAGSYRASSETVELTRALETAPYKYNFFQVVRLFEALTPTQPRFGRSARPAHEPLRLGQEPSLAFAPAMLAEFRSGTDNRPDYLAGYFFGLFGPNGPLPLHLTEHARDREKMERDPTFRRFADIFHHRMLSLFYRAWADTEPTAQFDRPAEDRFSKYVGSAFGIGSAAFRNRDALSDNGKLYLAGRLCLQTRPAEGMQAMLEELFQVPMHVEQYVGEWIELPGASHLRLGGSRDAAALGATATLGARVWSGQHKFRVRCGPLPFDELPRFLPGGQSLERLAATVRNYVGDELDWELRLVIRAPEVSGSRLGAVGQLGWTSWLGEPEGDEDVNVEDIVLHPAEWIQNRIPTGAAA